MSTDNKPTQEPSEEIDLVQLFRLIGKAFGRFFGFIGSIFEKIFLAFVWLVFFLKKNSIILGAVTVIGLAYGFIRTNYSRPTYSSQLIVKQNYKTGESLNNLVNYYNSLIREADTVSLSEGLGVSTDQAASLISFEMESVLSDNTKIQLYDNFKKEIDSTTASDLNFETFLDNINDYDFEYQRLKVKSFNKSSQESILPKIIDNVVNGEFFKNEQRKDLLELDLREQAIKEALLESDSLKKVYEKVLQKEDSNLTPSMNILISDTKEQSTTKEYELFNSDLQLRRELVTINREREDYKNIIEIISSSQENQGVIDNKQSLFGFEFSKTIFYGLLAFIISFSILIIISFMRYLEKFKSKVA